MHRTVLAPELSATFRRLSCWIIASPGPLENFDDPPPLELGCRTGLLHSHPVALLEVVDLVVGVEPGRALQCLLVAAVADALDDGHDDGLVHLGGHDRAVADLAAVRAPGVLRRGVGRGGGVGHSFSPASAASAAAISFSRRIVRIRAMSRFTVRNRAELSSCPVTIWNRRLNTSCLASARRCSSSVSSASRWVAALLGIRPPPPAARNAS